VAVAGSQIYISDYYHNAVDVFGNFPSKGNYVTQLPNEDSGDGPCQLAVGSTGQLYINNFHNDVVRFSPSAFPAAKVPPTSFGGELTIDTSEPTGVAIDPTSGRVYVDDRTSVAAYNPDGTPVMEGLEQLRIGVGNLKNAYGLWVTTAGKVMVADAGANSVKVFDPSVDLVNPVATVKAPGKGFNSLRDSSVAVDPVLGNIYVVDNLEPIYTEEPEAVVDVFNSSGGFLGVLKYRVFDALPPGLTTDSSGNVYVTSGNTDQAAVYGYAPNSQTASTLPPSVGAVVKAGGTGHGVVRSESPVIDCASECGEQIIAGTPVVLEAAAKPGSEFTGWSGADCADREELCTVTFDQARTVTATFEAPPRPEDATGATSSGAAGEAPPAASSESAARRRKHHRKRRHHRAGHHRSRHHRAPPRSR
jgi:hypothetical protein